MHRGLGARTGMLARIDDFQRPRRHGCPPCFPNRTTAYWTFGRREGLWKLKDVLPPADGEAAMTAENVDEESSPEQLQWYYQKTRAV